MRDLRFGMRGRDCWTRRVGEVSKINPTGPEAPALPGAPRH